MLRLDIRRLPLHAPSKIIFQAYSHIVSSYQYFALHPRTAATKTLLELNGSVHSQYLLERQAYTWDKTASFVPLLHRSLSISLNNLLGKSLSDILNKLLALDDCLVSHFPADTIRYLSQTIFVK